MYPVNVEKYVPANTLALEQTMESSMPYMLGLIVFNKPLALAWGM